MRSGEGEAEDSAGEGARRPSRIAVAFSGGLDTSWLVARFASEGHAVAAVTVDVGGFDDAARAALEARARSLGAESFHLVGARQALFDEVLRWLIAGNVRRGGTYPLCVGAERALQAREVARVARRIGAAAVAHGSTAAGNDQIRLEAALRATAPEIEVLAPVRDLAPTRAEEAEFLAARGHPVPPRDTAYSVNSGLWGTTIGGRETLTSELPLPEAEWVRTRGAFDDPRPPRRIEIAFERGIPVALDGASLEPVELIEALDGIAASFGIGRGIHLGETILGTKGRVAFEAPAATVLIECHRELEKLVLTGKQLALKNALAESYGELVHGGLWIEPAARDIEAFLASSQARVTGTVTALLRPGSCSIEGVTSPHSLLAASRGAYGEVAGDWTPADARGFARILPLPSLLHARAGAAASSPGEGAR